MGLIDLRPRKRRGKFRTYLRFNSEEAILPPVGTIYTVIKAYSDSLTEICCAGGRQLYQQDFVCVSVCTSIVYTNKKLDA